VARLKENLPELFTAAQQTLSFPASQGGFWVWERSRRVWDADDFDPWMALRWENRPRVVLSATQTGRKGVQAYWLTDFRLREVGPQSLFPHGQEPLGDRNQGFNEAKNHHDLEHIRHHHANSLVIAGSWLSWL